MNEDVLPNCRATTATGRKFINGVAWVPIYCGNCHVDGGLVPEENCTFAFWLCSKCEGAWGQLAATYTTSDEVFWEKVKQEQLERYGRELTEVEVIEALKDDTNPLAKLAKDRK